MEAKEPTSKVDVLVLGPTTHIGQELNRLLSGYQPYNLVTFDKIENFMAAAEGESVNPMLAIVSADKDTSGTCEWVQTAKMSYPHVPVLVLHDSNATLNFRKAIKNGANYVMHLHYDQEFISDRILQLAPVDIESEKIPMSALIAIHADDFEPATKIDFNLYVHLPSNQKTIMFRREGSTLDEKAIAKIRTSAGQRVYVKKTQLPRFFSYASQVLKIRNAPDTTSQTEKMQKVKNEIQTIMSYFLDEEDNGYEHGKKILERCEVILAELNLNKKLSSELIFQKLVAHNGQNQTIYNDCTNLCAYSTLFAKILDLDEESVKTVALAALLSTIGLAGLPAPIHMKPHNQWTTDDTQAFRHYPIDSVLMIKKKKVPLPQDVAKVIEQHREMVDGSGFPHALKGTQINRLAKIISIAWRFQSLTSLMDDRPSCTPLVAIEQILKENMTGGKMPFDGIMIQALAAFIKANSQRMGNKAA